MTFKLILSGVTGRIGSDVLQQSLQSSSVTSIVALSRRPLPGLASHSKLEVVVLKDFNQYSEEVIAKLSGADGCIWCMTTTAGDAALELEYPKAFAKAFSTTLSQHNKRFRYIHLTGGLVERDQNKSLWMRGAMRKMKGQGEVQMIEFAKEPQNNGLWETIIARPGLVTKRGTLYGSAISMLGGSSTIRSDELALALIDAVMHGSEEELLQPLPLLQRGQELMKKSET